MTDIEPTDLSPVMLSLQRWLAAQTPRTGIAYRDGLIDIARVLTDTRELNAVNWERIDYAALSMIREQLVKRYGAATVNRDLSAVRSFLRQLARDGLIPRERLLDLLEVRGVPRSQMRVGMQIRQRDQQAMLTACAGMNAPRFHRALLSLLLGGGLRISEVSRFFEDPSTYDPERGRILVRGKGRKDRTVYLRGQARGYVEAWLRDDDRGPWFRNVRPEYLRERLRKLALRAALPPGITPHDCRRTFASRHFAKGTDVATLQALMGHASPAQTTAYDRRGEERKVAAAHDPWSDDAPRA